MANTLTGIIPTLYEALNVVSREMVGFIPAVTLDSNASRAAKDQTVRVPVAVAGALEDTTPGATSPNTGTTTVNYADITITNSKVAPVLWNGEEQLAVGSTGTYNKILADQFVDGMRKLVNAVEADIALTVKKGSSRAYGTAGTAPFGTAGDLSDLAGSAQILDDNGAAIGNRQIVLNSAAIANLRGKQSVLFKVNEAGSNDMLRTGMTDILQNFAVRYSGGVVAHTKGTASGATTDNAGYAAGIGTFALASAGTGTLLSGDVITFAGDSNKYVVKTGDADVSNGGSLIINNPGILVAMSAATKAITVGNNYTGNYAFSRSAVVLAARAPATPVDANGRSLDSADDQMMLTDPVTGLTFEIRVYRRYREVRFEIGLAWGASVIKPEHVATLLG